MERASFPVWLYLITEKSSGIRAAAVRAITGKCPSSGSTAERSPGLHSRPRPRVAPGSEEKEKRSLTGFRFTTGAAYRAWKAISRSTPFPRSRTMSERQAGPVSQTLRATGSTYRRRIGPQERAGNRDKRRIAAGVRWHYDGPGECILLGVRSPPECRSSL